ncbi:DUF885 domain-containing protein [Hyphococcus luteus]|uniref:DUF885 domain-containing protein n=1 Tax=Hyphococcus luteus TaxID=2058213 RepID=A0A2S7JYK6_9PROT|nr:DUF885 domain-containing protein [Marinicaulis flavus]PQA85344.1 DUF885 domain-containing protein [Marinicaulis flavus]
MLKSLKLVLAATTALAVLPAAGAYAQEPADAAEAAQTEDERLAAFFEDIFQRNLAESPILQAQIGMKTERYGEWDDFSDAEAIRQNEDVKNDLARLRADFDYDALSEKMKVSYRIFEFLQERALADFPYRFHGYAFSTMNNPATFPATFLQNVHSVDDVSDAEAYISRLEKLDPAIDQLIEGIDMAVERGVVPTSFSFDPVLKDSANMIKGAPFDDSGEDNAIYADFKTKIDALEIHSAAKARLLSEVEAALTGPYKSAYENFIAKVESLRNQSPGPNGVWALPEGDDYYQNRIAFWTSEKDLSAAEIHKIGLKEVKRIRKEMKNVMKEVGFDGSLAEFFDYLRTDPSNFFPNTEEGQQAYLDQSKAYIDAIYADVDKYFNILPKAPLEVRKVEEWREETAPIAFYNRPSPDGSRPGIYYVNLKDMTKKQKHEMETVAYHEGAPGHHFQIAIQQELTGVPTFQKFAFFGAYTEGWGLYAERLAKEEGRFTDPMQDFGRLQNEMLRACRLVVDTGGHSKKWTREEMIQFMLDNNPMTEEDATKEVERYLDLPGQALSYKIGMMKILELRAKAKKALGDKFDIRDYHDVVLKNGAVPLPILEEMVDAYIAEKKAS